MNNLLVMYPPRRDMKNGIIDGMGMSLLTGIGTGL